MYNELINIGTDGNVFLEDDSIALMPCLWKLYKNKKMGSKMVRYIVSIYDYKSPFRRFPVEERILQVSMSIFNKEKAPRVGEKAVKDAIEEYLRFQYDPLIDQYNAMSDQMYEMTKVYRGIKATKENLDELNDIQKKMGLSAKSRDDIKTLILKDQESESNIKGTDATEFSMFEEDERNIRK